MANENRLNYPFYYFEGIVLNKQTGTPLPPTFSVLVTLMEDTNKVVYGDFAKADGSFKIKLQEEAVSRVHLIQVQADMCKTRFFPYNRTNSLFFLKAELEIDTTLFLKDTSFLFFPHSNTMLEKD